MITYKYHANRVKAQQGYMYRFPKLHQSSDNAQISKIENLPCCRLKRMVSEKTTELGKCAEPKKLWQPTTC